jgi:hypothetical protein
MIAMSAAPWIKHVRHAVWAAALAVGTIGATGNAWAQAQSQQTQEEDDLEDSILNADKKLLNTILKPLGLGGNSAPAIEYRERSPLVVPKGRDLPPPGKAVKGPDWPVEPEIKARKKESAELRGPGRKGQQYDASRPISGTPEVWKNDDTGTWAADAKARKEPDFFSMLFSGSLQGTWEENAKFEGEAPRTSLVQPPAGYLTPSPAAPYGASKRGDSADIGKPVPLPKGQDGDER